MLNPDSGEDAGSAACLLLANPSYETYRHSAKYANSRSGTWRLVGSAEQVFAAVLALFSAPLLLAVALMVALLSRRAPFVAHRRIGLGGEEIWVLKVRTMWDGSRGPGWPRSWLEYLRNTPVPDIKQRFDPRITSRFAAFCRRFSIDELPQLWQVARGTLALIGPRPLTALELERFYGTAAHTVLQVKPGVTGLWQVRGRGRLSYRQRRRLDLFLLKNWSFRLYLHILFASVPVFLSGKNAF